MFDHYSDRFDVFTVKDCSHFFDEENNQYTELMCSVQTTSAILFFFCIHIPLCRFHSAFSFLTAFVPVMLNLKTKYWWYERANDFVLLFYKKDPEAKNYVKK